MVALTYVAAIGDPGRFRKSRSVGALLGMVPRKHQSGEMDRNGRITKTGDVEARSALFEAAHVMLHRVKSPSGLKAWAATVARRQGNKRATVALARKMAVVIHRMWMDGTTFRRGVATAAACGLPPGVWTALVRPGRLGSGWEEDLWDEAEPIHGPADRFRLTTGGGGHGGA